MRDESARPWRSLSQELANLEATDPAMAEASRRLDEVVDELNDRAALHRFRPLPWDRTQSATSALASGSSDE